MKNDNNILIAAHLSVLLGFAIPFGSIVGPIIVLNLAGETSQIIKNNIRNIINFQIVWAILLMIGFGIILWHQMSSFIPDGLNVKQLLWIPIALIIVNFIYPVIVSIIIGKTKRNQFFYPTIIRFVKYK